MRSPSDRGWAFVTWRRAGTAASWCWPVRRRSKISRTASILAQPKDGWKLTRLPTLAPVEDAKRRPVKAEGAFIIEDGDSAMKVLVVFDGLPDGGARLYRVPLR